MSKTVVEKEIKIIPFELIGNIIYLQVSVNRSEPLTFILDTGASNSVIKLEKIDELNIKPLSKIPAGGAGNDEIFAYLIDSANLEIIGLKDFTIPLQAAFPFAEISAFEGNRADGVLGHEFFSSFAVEIDYEEKFLRLYDKTSFKYDGEGTRIPLEIKYNHPHLTTQVYLNDGESITGDFVVDTGSAQSLTLTKTFTEKNGLLEKTPAKIKTPTGVGAGGITNGFAGRLGTLRLGDFLINDPIVSFMMDEKGAFSTSDLFEGIVGSEILQKFRVIFDYENGAMILEKNSSFEKPQICDASGLFVAQQNGEFKVVGLTEKSPATESGICVEDILIEIEGVSASQFSLHEINEKLKAEGKLAIKIRRGNEVLEKVLNLRKLV